jgi:hypothetical protein
MVAVKFCLTDHTVPYHRTQYRCDSVTEEVNYTSTPSSLYHWTDVSGQLHDPAGLLPGECDTKNLNSLSMCVCCFVRILIFLRLHYGSTLNKKELLLAWSVVPGAYGRDAFFRYAYVAAVQKDDGYYKSWKVLPVFVRLSATVSLFDTVLYQQ